jgi:hypothetical protein
MPKKRDENEIAFADCERSSDAMPNETASNSHPNHPKKRTLLKLLAVKAD